MPKALKSAKTASKIGSTIKTKAKRSKRTDLLDKSPDRKKACSPVSAPLSYKKPSAANSISNPTVREARKEKRRIEAILWKAFHDTKSSDSKNALWVHYQSLVRYISERAKTRLPECIDVNDLMSAGNIGLQDAILKFDPERGTRFETFCVPRIRGSMVDSIRAMDWVPRLIRNKSHQYNRLVQELTTKFNREPTDEELAERLEMDLPRLEKLRKELDVKVQISLEGGNSDNADERDILRLEMLEDRNELNPTRELQREEVRKIALEGLQDNERTVIEQYYFKGQSMKQIGVDLELSESRICQIHAHVIEVLQKKFKAYQHSCFI